MSTPVEPLRLLLLADEPQWAALLHACMPALNGSAVLLTAPDWDSVDSLFSHDRQAVVLATPALQPVPGRSERRKVSALSWSRTSQSLTALGATSGS